MGAARLNAVGFAIRGDFRSLAAAKLRLVDEGDRYTILRAEKLVLLMGQKRLIGFAIHAIQTRQPRIAEEKGERVMLAHIAHDTAIAEG